MNTAQDGTNFLAVYEQTDGQGRGINYQLFSVDGSLSGPAQRLAGSTGGNPNVAFGGTNYLVVWRQDLASNSSIILGQRLARTGEPIGGAFAINTVPGSKDLGLQASLAFNGTDFLVVWSDERSAGNPDIYAQRIGTTGNLIGGEILIGASPEPDLMPAAAFDGTNHLVVWQRRQAAAPDKWEVRGAFVSAAGVPGTPFVVSQTISGRGSPLHVIFDGTLHAVTWARDLSAGPPAPAAFDIYGRRLTTGGTFVGNEIVLAAGPADQRIPSAGFDGARYLIAWSENAGATNATVRFLTLDSNAGPVGQPFSIFTPNGTNRPAAAGIHFDSKRFLITATLGQFDTNTGSFQSGDVFGTFIVPINLTTGLMFVERLVEPGQNVLFSGVPPGVPARFQWRYNGVNIPGASNGTFLITNVQPADSGHYSVAAIFPGAATNTQPARLIVRSDPLPFMDKFDDRVVISDLTGVGRGFNTNATTEPGEPKHAGNPGGKSLWIAWQAQSNGIATFRTRGSSFDTVLAAYTGATLTSLAEVDSDDDRAFFFTSELNFNAQKGITYNIAVDGAYGADGVVVLTWNLETTTDLLPRILTQPKTQVAPPGGNATFTATTDGTYQYQWLFQGMPIGGATNLSLTVSNVNNTQAGPYRLRVVSTAGQKPRTNFSLTAFLQLGTETNAIIRDKFRDVTDAEPGQTGLKGGGNRGDIKPLAAPAAGFTGTQIFDTSDAAKEPGEPNHCGEAGGASVWFAYQFTNNGTLTMDTSGSTYDTVLAVYTWPGGDFDSLVEVACGNSVTGASGESVLLAVTSGTTYYAVVDGLDGATGTLKLNHSLTVPPAITLQPQSRTVAAGSNVTLTVAATGTPAPAYQWQFSFTNVTGATSSSFTRTNFQSAFEGAYQVVVTNSSGGVTSSLAYLYLNSTSRFIRLPGATNSSAPFQYQFLGVAGSNYVIQANTNLSTTNWVPIATNNSASGIYFFSDPDSSLYSNRFYRAVPPGS